MQKFRNSGVQKFKNCRSSKIAGVQTIPQPTTIEPNEVDSDYCLNSCNSIFLLLLNSSQKFTS